MSLYEWLWRRIGGKPWTYIIREGWRKCEFLWIVGLVSAGIVLGHYYGWRQILTGWIIFSIGYALGHIFWSTSSEEWKDES